MSSEMTLNDIDVHLSDHAMLDCIPLRYGKVPKAPHGKFTGSYDDEGTQNQKPKEFNEGRKHYVGTLIIDDGAKLEDIRLVLAAPNKGWSARTVITAMKKNIGLATRGVTDLIRGLRTEGRITPEQIADNIHPLYISGKIKNEIQLFDELVRLGIQQELEDRQAYIDKILHDVKQDHKIEVDNVQETVDNLRERLKQTETKRADYSGEVINTAPVCTLKDVTVGSRINRRGEKVSCTTLTFYEDVPERKMDEWADPNGSITQLARSLIDKPVMTTVWQPNIYSPMHWWRNIGEVQES